MNELELIIRKQNGQSEGARNTAVRLADCYPTDQSFVHEASRSHYGDRGMF